MLSLRRGRVTAITSRAAGLARLVVEDRPCIAYPRLTGPIAVGDEVLVNTQALDLALGSGGFDVLHANLTRGLGLRPPPGAHVIKLPYTPVQHAVEHAEEGGGPAPLRLDGMPVVVCTLHSQLAAVCAGIGEGRSVGYVQVPGGALPVSLSDTVRLLRRRGLLAATVAVGACFDGELACVSVASALGILARDGYEVAVCAIGPGIVGTGSQLGHGAMGAVEAIAAAQALGGRPILVPRLSHGDARDRHRGLSHHTGAVLSMLPVEVTVAWPAGEHGADGVPGAAEVDVTGWRDACAGLPLVTMGRGPHDEPAFFAACFAAGRLAAALLGGPGAR